jgi:hypothetical protein
MVGKQKEKRGGEKLVWRDTDIDGLTTEEGGRNREERSELLFYNLCKRTRDNDHAWRLRPCQGWKGELSVGGGASFHAMVAVSQLHVGCSRDELA